MKALLVAIFTFTRNIFIGCIPTLDSGHVWINSLYPIESFTSYIHYTHNMNIRCQGNQSWRGLF